MLCECEECFSPLKKLFRAGNEEVKLWGQRKSTGRTRILFLSRDHLNVVLMFFIFGSFKLILGWHPCNKDRLRNETWRSPYHSHLIFHVICVHTRHIFIIPRATVTCLQHRVCELNLLYDILLCMNLHITHMCTAHPFSQNCESICSSYLVVR